MHLLGEAREAFNTWSAPTKRGLQGCSPKPYLGEFDGYVPVLSDYGNYNTRIPAGKPQKLPKVTSDGRESRREHQERCFGALALILFDVPVFFLSRPLIDLIVGLGVVGRVSSLYPFLSFSSCGLWSLLFLDLFDF